MTALDRLAKTGIIVEISKDIHDNLVVALKDTYTKDGCMLIGTCGRGSTAEDAAADYIRQLKGETVAVNPSSKNRREIVFI